MNKKEIGTIKRRLNPAKRYAQKMIVSYVGRDGKEIVRQDASIANISTEELEKYMGLFKKVFSGKMGQTMLPMDFETEQVANNKEGPYGVLYRLKESALEDEEAVEEFFESAINAINVENRIEDDSEEENAKKDAHVIIAIYDCFDVVHRKDDGEIDIENLDECFGYIMCVVCPVRMSKENLVYSSKEKRFILNGGEWEICAPEMGFMFPTFDNECANIYSVHFWTKDKNNAHQDFTERVMGISVPMGSTEQAQTIGNMMCGVLQEECTLELVSDISDRMMTVVKEHEEQGETSIPDVTCEDLCSIFEDNGVSSEKIEDFRERYDEVFGADHKIPAVNIATPSAFTVVLPDVKVDVNPEKANLVSTRVIDGLPYITILANANVEVNGVSVSMLPN